MSEKFETWAIVELFGHQVIAGKVTDQAVGGETFIRVDVPSVGDKSEFTRLFGKGAVYSITPTSEDIVQKYVQRNREEPIHPWMLEASVEESQLFDEGKDVSDQNDNDYLGDYYDAINGEER